MSFLHKLGLVGVRPFSRTAPVNHHLPHGNGLHGAGPGFAPVNSPRSTEMQEIMRTSKGLKEFLWNLEGLGRGSLLDLGPVWQTTLSFFIERGFRVTAEDLLCAWKDFCRDEEKHLQAASGGALDTSVDRTAEGRAVRFLEGNLRYPAAVFDAVLMWDLLDYLEPPLARRVVSVVCEAVRPGGVVFAMFHSRKPAGFHRYRVADSMTLQMLPAAEIVPAQRVYQNREIQDLFGQYRSMKSLVSRDQFREVLFIK
jgi:SAM-dependent methyltransferase